MSSQSWTLTDVNRGIFERDFNLTQADFPTAAGSWSVRRRVLQGGLSDGVDLIEVDNGRMRLAILPTRGMGIWRATIGEQTLGWKSPVRGPVHPQFVPVFDPSGLGWLEGFDELVVRCGLESNGAPEFDAQGKLAYPLHGRIANRPAHLVEVVIDDAAGTITVRGVVEETRFHFQKLRLTTSITTAINTTSFTLDDEVENFGGTDAGMQMLYHINIGEPLLTPGATLVAPVHAIEPRDEVAAGRQQSWDQYGQAVAGQPEACYFLDLLADRDQHTQVMLKNQTGDAGAAIRFSKQSLPCFTLWKNEVASNDGYVTGLEPATNLPNPRSAEAAAGRVIQLAPGETWSTNIAIDWLTSTDEVGAAVQAIAQLLC